MNNPKKIGLLIWSKNINIIEKIIQNCEKEYFLNNKKIYFIPICPIKYKKFNKVYSIIIKHLEEKYNIIIKHINYNDNLQKNIKIIYTMYCIDHLYLYKNDELKNNEIFINEDINYCLVGGCIEYVINQSLITNINPEDTIVQTKNIIFSNLMGGLGNLLFIVCTLLSYSIDNHLIPKLIIFDDGKRKTIDKYKMFDKFKILDDENISVENIYEKEYSFNELENIKNKNIKLIGYYQSYKYFYKNMDKIMNMLNFSYYLNIVDKKYNDILNKFDCGYTVSVHIRRTDYIEYSDFHHNQTEEYYKKALSYFNSNAIFVIFSDDIEWCKTQSFLIKNKKIVFIDEDNDELSMLLMAKCNHNICANSSFSLWASYFNKNNGISIIPFQWFGVDGPKYNIYDLMPHDRTYFALFDTEDETNDIIQFYNNNNYYINDKKIKIVQRSRTIGFVLVCTGKYVNYCKKVIPIIDEKFVTSHKKKYYVFTDNIEFFNDMKENYDIVLTFIYRKGFPNDTLYRYHYFLMRKNDLLNDTQYMYYLDVDMDIYEYIEAREVLPDYYKPLIGTRHPGFIMPHPFPYPYGSPETSDKSTAYIPESDRINNYVAGGFNGGITKYFIELSEHIVKNIEIDDNNNVIAVWHDESQLNNYYTYNNHLFRTLIPEYCYPEAIKTDLTPRIVALNKNHHEVRFKDLYISCESIDDVFEMMLNIATILSLAIDNNRNAVFDFKNRNKLYFNFQTIHKENHEFIQTNINDKINFNNSHHIQLIGDLHNIQYFNHNRNKIIQYFKYFDNTEIIDYYNKIIEKYNKNTISICIEQNDILDDEFYINAIHSFPKNYTYIILTDNIEYCKKIDFISKLKKVHYHILNDYYDLILMSLCKNNIVSNSLKNWWGAYLNENSNKVVITKEFNHNLILKEWVVI